MSELSKKRVRTSLKAIAQFKRASKLRPRIQPQVFPQNCLFDSSNYRLHRMYTSELTGLRRSVSVSVFTQNLFRMVSRSVHLILLHLSKSLGTLHLLIIFILSALSTCTLTLSSMLYFSQGSGLTLPIYEILFLLPIK
jgi:hypothetical protein